MKAISVTQLNNQIKSILESHFQIVLVEGEVSKVTYHSSGHLYFTIKDEKSSIDCAMWRSNLSKMKFRLKEGDKIYVYGAVNVYVPRGEYKVIAQSIEPVGVGALQLAFERLKEELKNLGYFDESRKKPLPKFPKKIAIVTSSTAAALQDMLRIAKKRWLLAEFYLFNTLVQGEEAAEDIARNIKRANDFVFEDGSRFDLIIVGRGGGSKEDLWPFNERVVADAIFEAEIPIISAVGHEIDYLISDFVADRRAATPSNAMEIALPDKNEILLMIDEMINAFIFKMENIISKKEKTLNHLKELFEANSIEKRFEVLSEEIKFLNEQFFAKVGNILNIKESEVINLNRLFEINSPINKINKLSEEINMLKKGFYNITNEILNSKSSLIENLKNAYKLSNPKTREKEGFGEIVKNGKRISLKDIQIDDIFNIENTLISVKVKALEKRERECFVQNISEKSKN
ncbi:exodeoxyribonuclease VII large subunit [Caminibacter sp.]